MTDNTQAPAEDCLSDLELEHQSRASLIRCDSHSGGANNRYDVDGYRPDTLGNELTPLAVHKDGSIEAFKHKSRNIFGIVWHPEREEKLNEMDLRIMEELMK